MEIYAFTWRGLNEQRQELGKELQETPFFKMQIEEDRKRSRQIEELGEYF